MITDKEIERMVDNYIERDIQKSQMSLREWEVIRLFSVNGLKYYRDIVMEMKKENGD